MKVRTKRGRVRIACFFLGLLLVQGLTPSVAWALTSGPAQPEMQQFQAAGTSDMVDLFTGDFKYNIPLLDVGGYPVNLSYASGVGMDDEASWVGLGWSLNAGTMNRQLRGIADDSDGDTLRSENYMKPKITGGGKFTLRGELFGKGVSGSVSLGVFKDNYDGWGSEVGGNVGLSLGMAAIGPVTPGVGVGLNSSTSDGVTVTPHVSLSMECADKEHSISAGNSLSFSYNTRQGLKGLTLSSSYSSDKYQRDDGNVSFTYNTPPFYPKSNVTFKSTNTTYTGDIGGVTVAVFTGAQASGYKSKREVLNRNQENRAFGLLYAEKGSNVPNALMDFMREKDNPVVPELNNVAMPIATPDIFSYTSQVGGGQLRLSRLSSGVFFDSETRDISDNKSFSAEYGVGLYFHGGTSVFQQDITNRTGKWRQDNNFLAKGDFAAKESLEEEHAYFQQMGEKHVDDQRFLSKIAGEDAVRVQMDGKKAKEFLQTESGRLLDSTKPYKHVGRQLRNTGVMYMTAGEAMHAGLEKQIRNYPLNKKGSFTPTIPGAASYDTLSRVSKYRKRNHISEMTVTEGDGKRMVYGLPVYNIRQDEYSFASHARKLDTATGLSSFETRGDTMVEHQNLGSGIKTVDEYYHKESQPAYATSYLLTGILSPDYVDITGNGITEDDRGTAFKFNYSKVNRDFQWRTPYTDSLKPKRAQFNRGLYADPDDDKSSFVCGQKELWYMHSIESKTMIAYFITEDRRDAIGADWLGRRDTLTKQQVLKEIRLYSKNNLVTPIKTVVFEYDYDLCKGIPNSLNRQGKLTLKSVYFKYASSSKGKHHPYVFEYKENPNYAFLSVDRWGNYKPRYANIKDGFGQLRNDEYPYSTQSTELANAYAGAWSLSQITLPTGGIINVDYESDDYAYVQDKRATVMSSITGMFDGDGNATASLLRAKSFDIKIDNTTFATTDVQQFRDSCLNGEEFLYMKLFVNVSDDVNSTDESKYDFVPCYGRIKSVNVANGVARVRFDDDTRQLISVNPFVSAVWQRMRLEYPRYAYPGYKNKVDDDMPVEAIVTSIANAIYNLSELWEPFIVKAWKKRFASSIKLEKSFARIGKMNGKKLGGGSRVKRIRMSDDWADMVSGQHSTQYGQEYDYTTTRGEQVISSGVAAYEPMVGADENPLRQPLKYVQDVKWTLDNFFYMEEPFGETLYPSPQVGYREVKVRSLGADGVPDPANKMGWSTYEFYTSKEYPVFVRKTNLEKDVHKPASWSKFMGGKSVYELTMSQGYTVFLNDMHGKSKAEKVFNQKGQLIASSEYKYFDEEDGGSLKLRNVVDVVDSTGVITKNQVIGRNIEVFSDMRESEMNNQGKSINLGLDVIPFMGFGLPLPHFPWAQNDDYRLFRSASVLKTVEYYGVVKSVTKTINGSSSTASNLLFDQYTGQTVVTQSQNEFEDPVYSMSIPAYWMYGSMGMAYKTLGTLYKNFQTDENGLPYPQFRSFLIPGDELVNVQTGYHTWAVNTPDSLSNKAVRMIDGSGRLAKGLIGDFKVYRSGNRNLLGAPATAITSLKNPILGNKLVLLNSNELGQYQVINASAVLYDEAWGQAVDCSMKSCPPGYQQDIDGNCYLAPKPRDTMKLVEGSKKSDYSTAGAFFYDGGAGANKIGESNSAFWRSRLNEVGIWLDNAHDYEWWGVEKCIDIPESKDYFIGHGSDLTMEIYIDDSLFFAFPKAEDDNYRIWNVRKKFLTKGKHKIHVEGSNNVGERSVGFEIYDVPYATLEASNESAIRTGTILSSHSFMTDAQALVFKKDRDHNLVGANFWCDNGVLPDMCDPTPNCDYKTKDECPEGYTRTADGLSCVPISVTEDATAWGLVVGLGSRYARYCENGTVFYDASGNQLSNIRGEFWGGCGNPIGGSSRIAASAAVVRDSSMARASASASPEFCGRLNNAGIWFNGGPLIGQWIGLNTCVTISESRTYYIGMAVDNEMRVLLDHQPVKELLQVDGNDVNPFITWKVYPIYLAAGQHILTIEATDKGGDYGVAVEIYGGTLSQLLRATSSADAKTIFSTENLRNNNNVDTYLKDMSGQVVKRRYSCPSGDVDICSGKLGCPALPMDNALNPYVYGYLGNWLPYKQMAWLTSRTGQDLIDKPASQGAGVRTGGAYQKFRAYWVYNSGWSIANNMEWVTSNTMTMYDQYSQELESKNALDLYSAARYGFKSTLPVAVGANMRQREIFYEGLEDHKFNKTLGAAASCEPDEFNIGAAIGGAAAALDSTDAHTGNYSMKLNGALILKTYVFKDEHRPGIYLENNAAGEYRRKADGWLGLRGFCPMNRKYVFSAWVRDNDPAGAPGITITINDRTVTLKKKAVVEGWKLVEGDLDVSEFASSNMAALTLVLQGNGQNVDDIRIFPYDGQLKTFAYDDTTQRVMAELDENNYATFYEYDDEGTLIRVKKETERGIMTIKESRSAYRKYKP
ncbi:hypothetical protein [Chitinophaga agri]|uniref:PA14 domain-containing protein n=1 Tax=Chitinophaga agri TaxID=2703787 RepID=A0A6B9ZPJ4_9BACT|nr:hypothetical protein [Chitinophaga agri]QHS63896.1 hypothetical protein GWR21_31245 [Chitinophaga agri]